MRSEEIRSFMTAIDYVMKRSLMMVPFADFFTRAMAMTSS